MHKFIHTLNTIPKNRYLELEIHRETTKWDELIQRFKVNLLLNMKHEYPLLDATLQVIRNKIFSEEGLMDFIMPSLCIAVITDLLDSGTTKERFSHLVHLEEDRFSQGSISKFGRQERRHGMIDTLNRKGFK
jgi:hypothetical protein